MKQNTGFFAVLTACLAKAAFCLTAAFVLLSAQPAAAQTVTISSPSAIEGDISGRTLQFTVTVKDSYRKRWVRFQVRGGTATAGVDFHAPGDRTVLYGGNDTTQTWTVNVRIKPDTQQESDETVILNVQTQYHYTDPSGHNPPWVDQGSGTGTITDDDGANDSGHRVTIAAVGGKSFVEGDSGAKNAQFDVTLSKADTKTHKVYWYTTDGTATGGSDYTASSGTLTFAAGQTSKRISVSVAGDTAPEISETFTVSLGSSSTGVKRGNPRQVTFTIRDDDTPTVSVGPDVTVTEGDTGTTTAAFTLSLDKSSSEATTVTVSALSETGDTATAGTDYTGLTSHSVTIAADTTTKTVNVAVTPDTTQESDETFTFKVDSVTSGNATLAKRIRARGTIKDDDSPGVWLSTTRINLKVPPRTPSTGNYQVKLTKPPVGGDVTITATSSDTASVTVSGSPLTFTATNWNQAQSISVSVPSGLSSQATSKVNHTISGAQYGSVAVPSVTVAIDHPDDDAVYQLDVTDGNVLVTEGGTREIGYKLASAPAPDGAVVTVTATSHNTSLVTVSGGPLRFDNTNFWIKQKLILHGVDDATVNADSGAHSNTTIRPTVDGSATINYNDARVGGQEPVGAYVKDGATKANVTLGDATATEGGKLTFTATLDIAVENGFSVTPTYTAGTALKTSDYTENTSAVTFSGTKGEQKTFTVNTVEDTTQESTETFTVGLTTTHAKVVTTDTGAATIKDDDNPDLTLSLSSGAVTVSEAGAEQTVTVTGTVAGSGSYTEAKTFKIDVGGGTATEGTDYKTVPKFNLTVSSGSSSSTATFKLDPTEDNIIEAKETINVTGTATGVKVTGASIGITDNENPAVTLSATPAKVSESAGATTVTVKAALTGGVYPTDQTVSVVVGKSGDSATEGTDYSTVADFDLTLKAGHSSASGTFTLTPTNDGTSDDNETISVDGTLTGATVTGTTITLSDATPAISLALSPASVAENAGATTVRVTASLTTGALGAAKAVTVSVGKSGDSAVSGTDYTTVSNYTISIPKGSTSATGNFTLTPTDNTVAGADKSITVSGTATGATVTGTTLALTDDEVAPAVNLSLSPTSATENGGARTVTVTGTLSTAVRFDTDKTVTVSVGDSADGATSGTDYAAVTDFDLTISKGQGSGSATFTLTPTNDTSSEGPETISVKGSATGLTVNSATLTLNDDDAPALTINDASATEGSSMTFTVTLDKAVAGGLTVTPGYTNGTAGSSDYTANTTALSFTGTANESKTFTVATTQDTVAESSETFTVGLTVSGTTLTVTATDTGTGTINDDDAPALTVNDASASEGDSMTFTVTLDKAVSGGLTVTPGYTNGTAASGDYTANTAALSFTGTANETKTFTVSTTEDAVLEGNETFTVGLTVSGTTLIVTARDTGTGTINNDDSAAVTVNDASASEGDAMTFTVTLDKAVQGGLTVTPGFTDGTATEGTDYDENTTGLTFTGTAGETQTFTVSTTEDAVLEGNETFTVGLSVSNAPSGVTSGDTGTGTINNDDSAAVTIDDASANEGSDITFTVTLSEAVQGGLTVTPGFTDVSAVEGTDYDENTTALSFTGAKDEAQTFTVSTTDDDVLENPETFTVGLSVSDAPSGVTATDTGTGTINDSGDNADSATVTINDANADEGDSMTFTVTLDKAVQGGLTVTPSFTDGTAVEGTDYDENTTALTFTGTANETKTFTVSTTEDAVLEANETFTVGLTVSNAPSGVTATDTGTGTVNNDDSATVSINDASADEGDSMTFTVTLDKAVQGGLTVTPGFTDGTATEGTDYDENTTALSFTGTADETKTFTVSTTEDTTLEGDETFTVGLTVSGTTLSVTATDTGTGTINNDDGATVTINDASASEGESMTFTVSLGAAVAGGLTVTPGFTDGTAVEGTDYDENTTALSFTGTANETKTFTVSTTEDAVLESNETFTVGLTVSGTTLSITATDTGTGTVNNDDSATVTIDDASANEGDDITFTVTLDKAVQGGLKVTPGFTDGTAVEGKDYDENTAALTFTGTANETQTFTVSTTDDDVLEHPETFTVGLSVSDAPSGVTASDTGAGTINDAGDNADSATVTINDASASEGSDMTFTVTLDKAVQGGLTVTPSFTDGTATEGTDYDENTTALSFTGTANETRTFTVSTTGDTDVEGNETFTVGLTVSNAPSGVTATDTGTGTINDNDNATVTVNDASANEGDDITFTVTLDKTVPGGLTVTPSFTDGTATEGTDYDENTTALSFTGTANESKSITVSTTQDTVLEGSETFRVGLTVSDTTHSLTATDTGTGTINDDDSAPAVNLSLNPSSVSEGASRTQVTVAAAFSNSNTYPEDRTVTISVGGSGSATSGTDYESVKDFDITIAQGKTSGTGTFALTPTPDTDVEGNETIGVAGSAKGLTVNSTELTLADDDVDVFLGLDSPSVEEGDSGTTTTLTFTAKLTDANGKTLASPNKITASYEVLSESGDTATAGEDYTATSGTLTFAPGDTLKTIEVDVLGDTAAEGDETLTLKWTGWTDVWLVSYASTGTITDDDFSSLPGTTPTPTVELKLDPSSISENGGVSTVTATLSEASNAVTEVRVSAAPVAPATAKDFTLSGTTLTFATGATTSTGTVTIRGLDNEAENNARQVTVSGTSAQANDPAPVILTITDDDGAPATPWQTEPSKPLYLKATANGQSRIDLEWWTPMSDGGARISGYRVFVSTDGGERWDILVPDTGTDATTYAHTGLRWGTTRHYQVAAINKVGLSERSNVAWATTETPEPPWKPNALTALAVGQDRIDLDWVVPLDGGSPITGYRVEVSADAGVSWVVLEADTGNTETNYSHLGLEPESTRHYRVAAINEMGPGAWSKVAWATTDPALTPGAVVDLSALAEGQTMIHLDWHAPEDDGGRPVRGYRIEVSQDTGSRWEDLESDTGTTDTTYAHAGLEPDSTRHYRVSAINEAGVGDKSNEASATTDPARVATRVLDLAAIADGQTLIHLDWREPAEDGGAAITGYRIEVSLDAGIVWTDLESDTGSTDTTYAHTGLEPATTGYYRVSAINEVGLSDPSNEATATTDPARVAARVIDLVAAADGQDVINLHWSEPEEDGGASITGYRIEVSADAGSRWSDLESDTRTTDTTYAHAGLRPDSTRYYRVSAWNEAGLGDPSNEAFATTVGKDAYNLAAFGRTVATSAVGVIGGRLNEAEPDTPSYLVLGGQTIRLGTGRREKRERQPRAEADNEWMPPAWTPPARADKSEALTSTASAPTGTVEADEALTPTAGAPAGAADASEAPATTTGAADAGHALPSIAGAPTQNLPLPGALASVSQWADNAEGWQALGSHYRLVPSGLERRPVGQIPSLREFLAASSLELHLGPGGARAGAGDPVSWTLWYDGELNRFAGQLAGGAQQGEVFSAYLGLDYHGFDNMTAGVALTHSTGEMDFDAGDLGYRNVDAKVTSLMPYLRWSPRAGWNLWALSGYGSGRMDVQESDNIEHRADLDLYLGAMGVRRELVRFDIGAELAVKADAFGVRVETEETDYLAGTTGDAGRVRLLLEGSGDWLLDDEQSIRPSVSIGARWDAGDAETGLGAELNAELGYDNVRLGLSLDLRGRVLLAHADEEYEEWGIGLGLQVDPGQLGVGWSFNIAPTWGSVAGEASGLWQGEQSLQDYAGVGQQRMGAGWRPDSTELRVQHGALGRRGVVTSFGEMHLAGAGYHDTRLGFRFEGGGGLGGRDWTDGMRYELRLEQQVRPHEAADYGLFLDVSGRF